MKVTRETIEHIADLACLTILDTEIEKLKSDMESILSFMEKLGKLDTAGTKVMEHVIPLHNVFREDEIKESLERDKLLKSSPIGENGCYKVPKVIE